MNFQTDTFAQNEQRSLIIPFDAQSVNLNVKILVFINLWQTVYSRTIAGYDNICLVLGGTTLSPRVQNC